ncbi:hypothetical protein ACSTLX_25865, partial [Vibrio parahaemolyticus]
SMYHINRPSQQLTGASYSVNPRTNFHAGGYFPISETSTLHLSASQIFKQVLLKLCLEVPYS